MPTECPTAHKTFLPYEPNSRINLDPWIAHESVNTYFQREIRTDQWKKTAAIARSISIIK